MSALATTGLFAFARPIEQLLTKRGPLSWPFLRWAVEPLTATVAASLVSLPILLYHFGRLSLIAPLANIVMLWAVPWVMEILVRVRQELTKQNELSRATGSVGERATAAGRWAGTAARATLVLSG